MRALSSGLGSLQCLGEDVGADDAEQHGPTERDMPEPPNRLGGSDEPGGERGAHAAPCEVDMGTKITKVVFDCVGGARRSGAGQKFGIRIPRTINETFWEGAILAPKDSKKSVLVSMKLRAATVQFGPRL